MTDLGKFFVYMLVALIVFVSVLHLTLRNRPKQPVFKMFLLSTIAVVGGMTFARIIYGKGVPWWIFYGLPAFITFALPPIVLKMSKLELLFYIPLSVLMAPAIHVFFHFSLVGTTICHCSMYHGGMICYKVRKPFTQHAVCCHIADGLFAVRYLRTKYSALRLTKMTF